MVASASSTSALWPILIASASYRRRVGRWAKGRNNNLSDSSNFRGIASSPAYDKIYDKIVLSKHIVTRNVLFGCQRYGIKVLDYFCVGQLSFRGCSFQKLYTNMNYSNNDVDFYVINLLNEFI